MLDKTLLRPVSYDQLARIGPPRDGGYVVPVDQLMQCRVLLSLGLNDDWSFDTACVAKNANLVVVGVDHTVGRWHFRRKVLRCLWKIGFYALLLRRKKVRTYNGYLRNALSYFSFFREPNRHIQKMVAGEDGPGKVSVRRLIDDCPAAEQADLFLKMDIEGSEYETIADIVSRASRIRCIAAEFHQLDSRTAEFNQAMRELGREFGLVHIHANNHSRYDTVNDFPSDVEVSFVNRRFLPAIPTLSPHAYPRAGLDFPCDINQPDVRLVFE